MVFLGQRRGRSKRLPSTRAHLTFNHTEWDERSRRTIASKKPKKDNGITRGGSKAEDGGNVVRLARTKMMHGMHEEEEMEEEGRRKR